MTIPAIALTAGRYATIVGGEGLAILSRLIIGQAFMQAGLGKLQNHESAAANFAGWGIPLPGFHAYAIGGLELVGGALLILGLATRPAAFLLLGTMAVAIMTAHRAQFIAALAVNPEDGLTGIVPCMFGLVLLALVAYGAGRLSLDRLLWSRCCGRKTGDGEGRSA